VIPRLATVALVALVGVLVTPAAAPAQTLPCPPGTPPAVEFRGLPSSIPYGVDHVFQTDFGHIDWDVVGPVTYTMADSATGEAFYEGTGTVLEQFYVRLDHGDRPVVVSADFVQHKQEEVYDEETGDYVDASITCSYSIAQTVAGYRHFYLASCDDLKYRPRTVIVACGDGNFQLRRIRWRTWNRDTAKGRARAMLNDCIPYCARGRFHSYRADLMAYRPRICRRGDGAEGYHYTRLRIRYKRPLSRRYFPWASAKARRGYKHNSKCFSLDS
jgi:hypothetical protein